MAFELKSLPLDVIHAAMDGDIVALHSVTSHYQSYIRVLATRAVKDEYGNEYLCVDESMRLRLEAKLMHSIITYFNILPA